MNMYDTKYEFRRAVYEDIPRIMEFIDIFWKKGHILGNNRDVFEWQYVTDNITKNVNMILAIHKATDEIHSILGYIPSSDSENKDIWGAVWKARDDISVPFLGMELHKRLESIIGFRYICEVGLNPDTSIKLLGRIFQLDFVKLNHYYMLSAKLQLTEYKIAKIIDFPQNTKCLNENCETKIDIRRINSTDELFYDFEREKEQIPYKDAWYIEWRYLNNPFYKYEVYSLCNIGEIKNSKKEEAILICRIQEYKDARVLRIMDYIGNVGLFSGLKDFFKERLSNENFEYIDFYNYGIPEQYVYATGMFLLNENDSNIIPDYFNPFEQRRVDIWGAKPSEKRCLLCKADADQDRPNK